jgi:hypothetical protein
MIPDPRHLAPCHWRKCAFSAAPIGQLNPICVEVAVRDRLMDIGRWIAPLFLAAQLFMISVFVVYAWRFRGRTLSADPAQWGQFGDFVGGLLNPVLSSATLTLICATALLQHRQLEETRREAAAVAAATSRAEGVLARQVRALESSVQLIALSQLTNYADGWVRNLRTAELTDVEMNIGNAWKERRNELSAQLEALYADLSKGISATSVEAKREGLKS